MLRHALLALLALTACAGTAPTGTVRIARATPDASDAGAAGAAQSASRTALQRTIRGHADEIVTCYEWELAVEPALAATVTTVTLQFVVQPDGAVSEVVVAGIVPATLRTEHLAECMMRRVRTWQFPCVRQAVIDDRCLTTSPAVAVVRYPWRFGKR